MQARLVLDTVLLFVFLLVMNTSATGIPIHEWLSIGVMALVVVHLLAEWDWTVRILMRFFKRLFSLSRLNLVLDVLVFLVFTLVMLSGFMVSQSIVPLVGLSVPFGPMWKIIHALSADVALIILGAHVGLHWRWIVTAVRRAIHPTPTSDRAD
jgi:hypothetical protein